MSKAKRPPKTATVSEQLRWYLKHCGVSTYRLERETGISNSTISRFIRGERGMGWHAVDVLGKRLGLQITQGRAG